MNNTIVLFIAALLAVALTHSDGARSAERGGNASIRPASSIPLTGRQQPAASAAPSVRLASPRVVRLKIGGGFTTVTLSGTHLAQVQSVSVVDSSGRPHPGIKTVIGSNVRRDATLIVRLIAGKSAAAGKYQLSLAYPADLGEVRTRPRQTLGGEARSTSVSAATLDMQVEALTEARISSIAPARPELQARIALQAILSDLPGNEVLSVTRFDKVNDGYCDIRFVPHLVARLPGFSEGIGGALWTAPHTLRLTLSQGSFSGRDTCALRFTVRTKNELGEEFLSVTPSLQVRLAPARPLPSLKIPSTSLLKDYLVAEPLRPQIGVCSGHSLGAHGSFPVGVVSSGGRLSFRIRSGPIGTDCGWKIGTNRIRNGWTLRLQFRKRLIGQKCGTTDGSTHSFDFSRTAYLNVGDEVVSISANLNQYPNSFRLVQLKCGVTLSNDHEIAQEIVSAEMVHSSPSTDCDWRCGFE